MEKRSPLPDRTKPIRIGAQSRTRGTGLVPDGTRRLSIFGRALDPRNHSARCARDGAKDRSTWRARHRQASQASSRAGFSIRYRLRRSIVGSDCSTSRGAKAAAKDRLGFPRVWGPIMPNSSPHLMEQNTPNLGTESRTPYPDFPETKHCKTTTIVNIRSDTPRYARQWTIRGRYPYDASH